MSLPPRPVAPLALAVAVTVALAVALAGCGGGSPSSSTAGAVTVDVGSRPLTRPLPGGYVGLSIEYPSSIGYAGRDPRHPDPVYLALVRALAPGARPVIRFGGDTTDWTWWPVPGQPRPAGIRYTLTRRWLAVTAATARALNARLILGLNLEADSARLAGTEARELLHGLGRRAIAGFELGNEPEAYGTLGWYFLHHVVPVYARPAGYDFSTYLSDYRTVAGELPRSVALAGPASGAPDWLAGLPRFLRAEPRVRTATFHRYPLHRCAVPPRSPTSPSIAHLLAPVASSGPATSLAAAVAAAHARGIAFRADELNSVSCGGARGVSDTFASALWILDTLFNMDRVGVDGVNIHTFRTGIYAPFAVAHRDGRWTAVVRPEYYGLILFSRAAPAGSRLLPTRHPGFALRIWTTRGRDGRLRVLLINTRRHAGATVAIRLPVSAAAPGELERLTAPAADARSGETLAGQRYGDPTATGQLTGALAVTHLGQTRGRYVVRLPAASAALLTVTPR